VTQVKERIRVLLVDDVAETRENLRKLLSFASDMEVVGTASSGPEAVEVAQQCQPHIILMDINMPGMDGIAATEVVLQKVPVAQVIMLSVQGESDYLRRAMMAGARDFLTKPPSGDELMSTIRRVYETGKKRAPTMAPLQPTVSTMTAAVGAGPRDGRVIAVFSPKGGAGCTTIAVNLAIALQRISGSTRKVALVDTNLQFGDVGVMLNMPASRSIADLAAHIDELDSDLLSSVMTAHGSGVKVLLAPPHPEAAESILASKLDESTGGNVMLKKILDLMRREFDFVVVDMWSWVDAVALTVFDAAALIVLVVTPNIPSIKNARLFLEIAGQLNYPTEEIALAINGVDRRAGIRADQIQQALLPVAAQIPLDEQAALMAANKGVPFIMHDQNRPIAQGILQLAERVQSLLTPTLEEEEKVEEVAKPAPVGTGLLRLGRVFR
jgi:pilus assembly protein CpaE